MKLTQPLRYFKNDYDLIRTPKGFTEMLTESCNSYPYIRGQGWCDPLTRGNWNPSSLFAKHKTLTYLKSCLLTWITVMVKQA